MMQQAASATGSAWFAPAVIVAVVFSAIGVYFQARQATKTQRDAREAFGQSEFMKGAVSRDPEVAQLKADHRSELRDARTQYAAELAAIRSELATRTGELAVANAVILRRDQTIAAREHRIEQLEDALRRQS